MDMSVQEELFNDKDSMYNSQQWDQKINLKQSNSMYQSPQINNIIQNTPTQLKQVNEIIEKLKDGTNNDQSLAKILDYIKNGSEIITQNDQDVVILMGMTGTGKTSLAAYLSDIDLIVKETNLKEPYLNYLEKSNFYGQIGTGDLNSETMVPNKFVGKDNIIYWDCPGFFDTRGEEVNIANSFYMSKILLNASRAKLILVLDGSSFLQKGYGDMKGEGLKVVFETLNYMISESQFDFSKNLIIIFTKTCKNLEFYKVKLHQFFEEVCQSFQNNKLTNFYMNNNYQTFFNNLKESQILLFPLPQSQQVGSVFDSQYRQYMIQSIKQIEFYNGKDLKIPLTVKSLQKLSLLWDYSRGVIKNQFSSICEKLSQPMKSCNEKQLLQINELLEQFQNITNKDCSCKENLQNIKIKFLKNFLDILINQDGSKQFVKQNKIIQQIDQHLLLMKFFIIQVYEGLLQKINQSNNRIDNFFGVFGDMEINKGFILLKNQFDKAYLSYTKKQMDQQQEELLKLVNNLEKGQQQQNEIIEQLNQNILNIKEKYNLLLNDLQLSQQEQMQQQEQVKIEYQKYIQELKETIKDQNQIQQEENNVFLKQVGQYLLQGVAEIGLKYAGKRLGVKYK